MEYNVKIGESCFLRTVRCRRYNGEALLLRRSATSGNPGTLGLPGGNKDAEDEDLMTTALREAREEMGSVPPHGVLGQIFTRFALTNVACEIRC